MNNNRILIVDDDAIIRNSLIDMLEMEGFYCCGAENFRQGMVELEKNNYSILITDINLPDNNGLELLKSIKKYYPEIIPIVITGYGSIISAVDAVRDGAFEYLTKPINDEKLKLTLKKAVEKYSLKSRDNATNNNSKNNALKNIIGNDYKMMKIYEMIDSAAPTRATVLITGKSGTGKSLTARAIHQLSDRSPGPFIEVSCGALSETLLESELFGHAKGAFTGADNAKDGKFLAANGGTIFLDEINSASPALQLKLLRIIQERQFEPVGSNETKTVDVRILLATNKDLAQMVANNEFREDLFYRINVINIHLPVLSERVSDIPILADYLLNRMCLYHSKKFAGFTDEAVSALISYSWPGNVRELENTIERAVVLGRSSHILASDLPDHITNTTPKTANESLYKNSVSLKKALEKPERDIIMTALKKYNWNRNKTAEVLEINRTTLYKKMKYYNLTGS